MSVSVKLGNKVSLGDNPTKDVVKLALESLLHSFDNVADDSGLSVDWSSIQIETEANEYYSGGFVDQQVSRYPTIIMSVEAR